MIDANHQDYVKSTQTGTIYIVDPSPLNWLYVLFNTMEEAVRADHQGRIVPSLARELHWVNDRTLELSLRNEVIFHNHEPFTSYHVQQAFHEERKWIAPHPPGTWVNLLDGTTIEAIDENTVRFHFPKPDGLATGKLRVYHIASLLFWNVLGFGYKKFGTAEGHW
ncbi:ABC transporter substrate-binding protein [Bacillus salitolerans]|uniref:ABC transporter substrate-binding protein n=1 Tax=Bacillus salitolerans TaxID=1437434 RepID=A0ABW4LUS6_9BACI